MWISLERSNIAIYSLVSEMDASSGPFYLTGHIALAVTPVAEIPADLRDGAENLGQGYLSNQNTGLRR